MKCKSRCIDLRGLVVALAFFTLTLAHAEDDEEDRQAEATLFFGYGFGGKLEDSVTTQRIDFDSGGTFGVAFNWESEDNAYYEIAYTRLNSAVDGPTPFDITLDYLHVGGHVTFEEDNAPIIPYFLITIGATRFSPDLTGLSDLTKFSTAIGGGAKFSLTPKFALRADARLYASFLGNQSDVFCQVPGASCVVHLHGETVLQTIVSIGATLRW